MVAAIDLIAIFSIRFNDSAFSLGRAIIHGFVSSPAPSR
jgi:hypothetical protein